MMRKEREEHDQHIVISYHEAKSKKRIKREHGVMVCMVVAVAMMMMIIIMLIAFSLVLLPCRMDGMAFTFTL